MKVAASARRPGFLGSQKANRAGSVNPRNRRGTVPPTRAKSARRRFLLRHSTGHDSHTVRVPAPRKMLLLFETPAGFSLFKVKDEGKLDDAEVRRPPLPQENFARHRRRLCYLSHVDGWGCARHAARGARAPGRGGARSPRSASRGCARSLRDRSRAPPARQPARTPAPARDFRAAPWRRALARRFFPSPISGPLRSR